MFNELAYTGNLGRNYRHTTDHGLEQNVRNSVPVSIFQNQTRKHEEVRLWI